MKKPTKKFKRYQDGGDVAADKQRGLDISNKEEPVGFFERIRMGNIDEPGSEAYNRFGAGRGRATPFAPAAEEVRPSPVPRIPPQPNPIFAAGMEQGKRQSTGDASVMEDYAGPRTKPIVTTPVKPAASKPVAPAVPRLRDTGANRSDLANKPSTYAGPMRGMRSDAGTSPPIATHFGPREEERSAASKIPGQSVKAPKGEKIDSSETSRNIENALLATGAGGVGLAGLYKMFKGGKKAASAGRELVTSPSKTAGRVSKTAEAAYDKLKKSSFTKKKGDDVTDVTAKKRGGAVKKYASGGMVSSASRRADGIATKGKTRGKIC
jgi:hypothetical protein